MVRSVCAALGPPILFLPSSWAMVRMNVLPDALKGIKTAEKRGKYQDLIRSQSHHSVPVTMKHSYISEFEITVTRELGKSS